MLEHVYRVNVVAPLALAQLALPRLPQGGRILNVTSDAAVEPYAGWGGYGSTKAALEQLTASSPRSIPTCGSTRSTPATCARRCTRTRSRARTSPTGPPPEASVPGLLALIEGDRPSGRYRASDLAAGAGDPMTAPDLRAAAPSARRPRRPRRAAWPATRSG